MRDVQPMDTINRVVGVYAVALQNFCKVVRHMPQSWVISAGVGVMARLAQQHRRNFPLVSGVRDVRRMDTINRVVGVMARLAGSTKLS